MYMIKLIGIVNFNNDKLPEDLIKVFAELSDNVIVISHKENYLKIIKESCITNWVFSSSDLTPNTKKIEIDFDKMFKITNKNFLLLGFTMKKLLKHLGYKMYKRSRAMKMRVDRPGPGYIIGVLLLLLFVFMFYLNRFNTFGWKRQKVTKYVVFYYQKGVLS